MLNQSMKGNRDTICAVVPLFVKSLSDASVDVRITAARKVKQFSKTHLLAIKKHPVLGDLLPPLCAMLKDKNLSVKSAGERAVLHLMQAKRAEEFGMLMQSLSTNETSTFLADYQRRVLSKLNPWSDTDSDIAEM